MFGRKKRIEQPLPLVDEACSTQDACFMDRLESERYLTDSLDERESEQLQQMVEIARSWEVVTSNVAVYINDKRRAIELGDAAVSVSRADRRSYSKDRSLWLSSEIACAHDDAARTFADDSISAIYRENLVNEGSPPKFLIDGSYKLVMRAHNKLVTATERVDQSRYVQQALSDAFRMEYIIRAYMQRINQDNPDVLQTVFDPVTLRDLPYSLQRIATLDVNRGEGASILLDNAKKLALGEQNPAERLANYIKTNNIPDQVKKTLVALNIGMKAMGSPTCPFNDMGICTHQLSRVPESSLPEDVKKDLESRDATAAQRRTSGLLSFAQHNPVSKILDANIQFDSNATQTSPTSRKRSSLPVRLEKRDLTMIEKPEIETPSFNRVVIRFANQEDQYVIEDPTDKDAFDVVNKALIGEKMVKSYLSSYNDPKLEAMILNAFSVISTSKTYTPLGRTITQWVASKNKAHVNDDDVKEQFMRYSGAQASGVSGGPNGRNTRIIFSQGTKNDTRYVTIHKVTHKSNLKTNPVLR
jgi:hypothetical protein